MKNYITNYFQRQKKKKKKTEIKNAFADNMSMNIKFRKNQLSKIIQLGEVLGFLLGKLAAPLTKVGFHWAKNFLAPLSTMGNASATDTTVQKKCVEAVL